METIEYNIKGLKADIKKLAENQRFLKNQRKTVYIVGERKMPAAEASWRFRENRYKLRILYAAYGVIRGKTYAQIENNHAEEEHPLMQLICQIDKVIETYKQHEEVLN